MAGRQERLVRRVQRELQASGRNVAYDGLTPHEMAELEGRARRLREAGPLFEHVRLSTQVMPRGMTATAVRGGGGLVATEV